MAARAAPGGKEVIFSGFICREGGAAEETTASASPGRAAIEFFQLLRSSREAIEQSAPELSPELEAAILNGLDAIQANDFNVAVADVAGITCRSGLGYQEVFAGPEMTLCIFLMQAGARIPLHDHPGMRVYGRLLFGRMRVRSFDIAQPPPAAPGASAPPPGALLWAAEKAEKVMGPAPTTYSLGPKDGNIHELEALEASAFFDVLAPPYDPHGGRDCCYYRLDPWVTPRYFALLPVDPRGFTMDSLKYKGPRF